MKSVYMEITLHINSVKCHPMFARLIRGVQVSIGKK